MITSTVFVRVVEQSDVLGPIIGGVVGALAGVFGVMVGARMQRRGEEAAWRRSARLASYSELIGSVHQFELKTATYAGLRAAGRPSGELAEALGAASVAIQEVRRAAAAVTLVGPQSVRVAANVLHTSAWSDFDYATRGYMGSAPYVSGLTEKTKDFVDASTAVVDSQSAG